ncbi:acetyl-CoA carboxylase biotin carboxylase subunit family protein (plasmid) [Mesorhizobium sp. AR10]|uniref:ATP-grasp domain-containing protein n=1 Tax=Mesorhizobium sp. AR10 TaxID=2865839 RepID=UPI002160FBF4|nr:acetyl-CoA carboxylase biotin carboxylase subunit family protein [Mesorhizobium sp. AR10]UVK35771.1 acetyl-CoA carboxylase biotin carboxylase subunit family protein [Mesorhizobium sp. AR10]
MARKALILIEGDTSGNGMLYVQAARRLGLHPITLSADPTQYGYVASECIEAIRADTDNLDALIRECSRLRTTYDIAGITGFASLGESVYAMVAKLCRHFDLPGPDPASIERCCDKFVQHQILTEAGVPIPGFRLAANATEVEDSATDIRLPVVVKPAVGTGSTGVRLCRTVDELAEHATHLLGGQCISDSPPKVLVEEFAQGSHYSIEVMGNEVFGIAAADFGRPPHFVCREYIYPATLTDDEYRRIADVSLRCLRALGLGWGPTNIDVRWTKLGPVVIEVNPRLAGTPTPQLVKLAYGVDLVTEHIKLVIGDEWNLCKRHSRTAVARSLIPDRDGILDWIDGDSQAAAISGVAEVKFYAQPKMPIVRKGDWRDKIGYVTAVSPSLPQTEAILQRAVDLIHWSISPFPAVGEQEQSAAPDIAAPAQMAPGKR